MRRAVHENVQLELVPDVTTLVATLGMELGKWSCTERFHPFFPLLVHPPRI